PVWLMHDYCFTFFFSSRRRHTRFKCDWSSDVCSSDLRPGEPLAATPVTKNVAGARFSFRMSRMRGVKRGSGPSSNVNAILPGTEIGRASCRERCGWRGRTRRYESKQE